jgi:hypothetical protein
MWILLVPWLFCRKRSKKLEEGILLVEVTSRTLVNPAARYSLLGINPKLQPKGKK